MFIIGFHSEWSQKTKGVKVSMLRTMLDRSDVIFFGNVTKAAGNNLMTVSSNFLFSYNPKADEKESLQLFLILLNSTHV